VLIAKFGLSSVDEPLDRTRHRRVGTRKKRQASLMTFDVFKQKNASPMLIKNEGEAFV